MSGILQRLARFLGTEPRISEPTAEPAAEKPDTAFAPVDSNADTVGWFSGGHLARRDSIESNPDTARWYRRPRFTTPRAAAHRTSFVEGGE